MKQTNITKYEIEIKDVLEKLNIKETGALKYGTVNSTDETLTLEFEK